MAEIHHSISISASPEVVDALVSTAEGFREWWAEDVEPQPDGSVGLGFFDRTTVYRLRLVERSALRVTWHCETGQEWQHTDLIFHLQPQSSGVLLDFLHANWHDPTPYFVSCNTTWGALMFRLKSTAEGRAAGPLFRKDSMEY
jgi:hypothetical protein